MSVNLHTNAIFHVGGAWGCKIYVYFFSQTARNLNYFGLKAIQDHLRRSRVREEEQEEGTAKERKRKRNDLEVKNEVEDI